MAKLSRKQLKSLVKECLVEILTEGIAAPEIERGIAIAESRQRPRKERRHSAKTNSVIDEANPSFEQAVEHSVNILTENPLMQGIFNDTARTTLQSHLNDDSEIVVPGALGGAPQVDTVPIDQFEGASNKWAALAFVDPKPRPGE